MFSFGVFSAATQVLGTPPIFPNAAVRGHIHASDLHIHLRTPKFVNGVGQSKKDLSVVLKFVEELNKIIQTHSFKLSLCSTTKRVVDRPPS